MFGDGGIDRFMLEATMIHWFIVSIIVIVVGFVCFHFGYAQCRVDVKECSNSFAEYEKIDIKKFPDIFENWRRDKIVVM